MKIEIIDTHTACPYCMEKNSEYNYRGCCGEASSHFIKAHEISIDGVRQEDLFTDEEISDLVRKAAKSVEPDDEAEMWGPV